MTVRAGLRTSLVVALAITAYGCVTAASERTPSAAPAAPSTPASANVLVPGYAAKPAPPKSEAPSDAAIPGSPEAPKSAAPTAEIPNGKTAPSEVPRTDTASIQVQATGAPKATTPTNQTSNGEGAKTENPTAQAPMARPRSEGAKRGASKGAAPVQNLARSVAQQAPGPSTDHATAPLDLASLERRLRDTKAIGVFTKLSLKNQVDDLLAQVRLFHRGQSHLTLEELKERFNLLLLKVLSLLQAGDPALAHDVAASREALWGILEDPVKFAAVTQGGSQ